MMLSGSRRVRSTGMGHADHGGSNKLLGEERDLSKRAPMVIANSAGKRVMRRTEDVGGPSSRVCARRWSVERLLQVLGRGNQPRA